ncbi:MAG: thiamine pyrophosphate-binding protein [Hyphomicrobiales bacterium]|nr:thiamine pyrophosphate-binding protein [Hyphomicrobiales bacterium]
MTKQGEATKRSGGQVLVDQLLIQGVRRVFCVPGESYLAVLDALYDSGIEVIVCRQEGGATMMADAYARLTGEVGVVFVTRGPGATNAAPGVHIAEHDSVPIILFIGQVGRSMRGRGAFQEMDFGAVFGSFAKWVAEISEAARLPEMLSRAFHVTRQGRHGPVVLALPEDMLRDETLVADAKPANPVTTWPGQSQMDALQKRLAAAARPIAILGGSGWNATARAAFQRFAERFELPVATSFRRAMLFDGDHPLYVGEIGIGPNPKLRERISAADLVLLAGARMSEMPSQGYQLFEVPKPRQSLVHVHADAHELGRVYQTDLAIHASPAGFAAALEGLHPPATIGWAAATREARAQYLAWSDVPPPAPDGIDMGKAMLWLRQRLAPEAIVSNGAGNYAIWPGRFLRFRRFATQLAPTSGSMGYGIPAAVSAAIEHRDRQVVAFAGDGCFLMNGQEFATAVQYQAKVIVIVVDNGMYGTIRMHQERHYPGRISATALKNPDFAALARAYGGFGATVRTNAEFEAAFAAAEAAACPALLHVLTNPEALTPNMRLAPRPAT